MSEAGAARLIKRYRNRKLYDAAERRYVTLEELQGLVGAGLEVRVVDQETGDDVTSLTLAQILLEGLRQRTARIPQPLLVQLVRLTAAPGKPAAAEAGAGPQRAREEAERIVRDLLARGRLTLEEAVTLRQDIVRSWSGLLSEAQAGLRQFLGGAGTTPRKRETKEKKRTKNGARTASLSLARRPVRRAKERARER